MGIRDNEEHRRRQTLDQLEGIASGEPGPEDTSLVVRCLRLRKVPIGQLAIGELRLLIGQREGLMFLIPLAMEQLVADPLVDGTYYPGDLLCAVLRAGAEFWRRYPILRANVAGVISDLREIPQVVAEALGEFQAAGRGPS